MMVNSNKMLSFETKDLIHTISKMFMIDRCLAKDSLIGFVAETVRPTRSNARLALLNKTLVLFIF